MKNKAQKQEEQNKWHKAGWNDCRKELIDQLDTELQYAITKPADLKRVREILKTKLK